MLSVALVEVVELIIEILVHLVKLIVEVLVHLIGLIVEVLIIVEAGIILISAVIIVISVRRPSASVISIVNAQVSVILHNKLVRSRSFVPGI